jgi:GDP-D-mannose dehydratase
MSKKAVITCITCQDGSYLTGRLLDRYSDAGLD